MDRLVAALRPADGVGAAGIGWTGDERVVAPFAMCAADRMNGRHVQNVESHSCNGGEARDDVAECAGTCGIVGLRAGKKLVPAREPSRLALGLDEIVCAPGEEPPLVGPRHGFE